LTDPQQQIGQGVNGKADRPDERMVFAEWWRPASAVLSLVLRHKMVMLMVGGAVGTILRYWVGRWFNQQPWGRDFPWGTLFINVSGSFVLGFAAVVILERLPPEHQDWYLLIGTGFCGGYTTFSTFEWETFRLIRDGSWPRALYNVLGSVGAGFLGVVLAVLLANLLFTRR
jgi:CrcB protein